MVSGTPFEIVGVEQAWPTIAARLPRTRTDAAGLEWTRGRCVSGDALCLQCADGVVILGATGTEDGKIIAKVLLAVSLGSIGAFKTHEAAMLAVARDIGASELQFETDRRGWARMVGPQWREVDGVFARSV